MTHNTKRSFARRLLTHQERASMRHSGMPLFSTAGWSARAGHRERRMLENGRRAHVLALVRQGVELSKDEKKIHDAHVRWLKERPSRQAKAAEARAKKHELRAKRYARA